MRNYRSSFACRAEWWVEQHVDFLLLPIVPAVHPCGTFRAVLYQGDGLFYRMLLQQHHLMLSVGIFSHKRFDFRSFLLLVVHNPPHLYIQLTEYVLHLWATEGKEIEHRVFQEDEELKHAPPNDVQLSMEHPTLSKVPLPCEYQYPSMAVVLERCDQRRITNVSDQPTWTWCYSHSWDVLFQSFNVIRQSRLSDSFHHHRLDILFMRSTMLVSSTPWNGNNETLQLSKDKRLHRVNAR